jgi:hypothetical protein
VGPLEKLGLSCLHVREHLALSELGHHREDAPRNLDHRIIQHLHQHKTLSRPTRLARFEYALLRGCRLSALDSASSIAPRLGPAELPQVNLLSSMRASS